MNKSNLMHGLIAGAVTLAFSLAGLPWLGAGLSVGFYLGREHAQREYKLGGPLKVKPWQGFTGWSKDEKLDFLFPLISSSCILFMFL